MRILVLVLVCGISVFGSVLPAHADAVTDTLSIKVGYFGMKLDEYVDVDTYHWRDLRDQLNLHQQAYSYFQSESKTKYNAIVDAAQGFYITDILNLAGIYYGDVSSLRFYVEDHKGIRTTFDKSALFASRYYYDDVAGNRTIVYGKKKVTEEVKEIVHHDAEYKTETYIDEETGEEKTREVLVKEAWDEEVTKTVEKEVEDKSKIVEYKFDNAKNHATQVQPMLAIEDNWAQFSEEFEHVRPDFANMNPGTRFRLLFGQTSPTESMTSKSDKYVSCVYVTLEGTPKIDDMGDLDGKKGSHTVDMTVSSDNVNIRDALSKLMNVNSTNTDVLVITGINVTPDSKYSDLAKVTVSYDIVGDGQASITAGVGAESEPLITSKVVEGRASASTDDEQSESGSGAKKDQKESQSKNKKQDTKKSTGKNGQSNKASDGNQKSNGTADNAKVKEKQKKTNEIEQSKNDDTKQVNEARAYLLSDAVIGNIEESMMNQTAVAPAAEEDIEQVKIEDKTEENEKHKRQLLLFTGLGCLFIGVGGSVTELVSFRLKLKGVGKQWS